MKKFSKNNKSVKFKFILYIMIESVEVKNKKEKEV